MTTTQEPQKGTMEEVELDFPYQDDNYWLMIDVSGIKVRQYPSPLEVKMLIHHQLQKARQDWLRQEIVRLEGAKRCEHKWSQSSYNCTKCGTDDAFVSGDFDYNEALQTIIDRYQAELDQEVSK